MTPLTKLRELAEEARLTQLPLHHICQAGRRASALHLPGVVCYRQGGVQAALCTAAKQQVTPFPLLQTWFTNDHTKKLVIDSSDCKQLEKGLQAALCAAAKQQAPPSPFSAAFVTLRFSVVTHSIRAHEEHTTGAGTFREVGGQCCAGEYLGAAFPMHQHDVRHGVELMQNHGG